MGRGGYREVIRWRLARITKIEVGISVSWSRLDFGNQVGNSGKSSGNFLDSRADRLRFERNPSGPWIDLARESSRCTFPIPAPLSACLRQGAAGGGGPGGGLVVFGIDDEAAAHALAFAFGMQIGFVAER